MADLGTTLDNAFSEYQANNTILLGHQDRMTAEGIKTSAMGQATKEEKNTADNLLR